MFPPDPAQRLNPLIACVAAVVLTAMSPKAWAIDPFSIKDIRVEGLQRSDPGTVFAALPFRVGDLYSEEKGAAAVRALFATGLFKDVRLQVEDQVLVVVVEERPIIGTVDFVGIKEFDRDTLVKALKDAGISEGQPFDRALVDRAEQEIKPQYLTRSLYGAEVVTTVTPQERNRVSVTFTTTEGDPAKIREIRVLGAKVFKEKDLTELFEQTPSGWFTWYSKRDRYARSKLNADLEALRAHYTNRGYLEFAVESTQVTMSPDKQSISIVISVREGQPYTVTRVTLAGELLGRDDEFKSLIAIKPGVAYRSEDVAETQRRITERFGVYGYAFARVEARQDINRETGQVELNLVADPGRRAYVRRINISGNTTTRDEVIRREMRLVEGDAFNKPLVDRSKTRLTALNYFEKVEITEEPGGAPDRTTLQVEVEEKPTGELSLGLGYSSSEQLVGDISVSERNLLGRGQFLALRLSGSSRRTQIDLRFTEPYFLGRPLVAGFDIYNVENDFDEASYSTSALGLGLRLGFPVSEFSSVGLRYTLRRDEYSPFGNLALDPTFPRGEFLQSSIGYSYAFSTLDDPQKPTSGTNFAFEQDIAGLGGDISYVRSEFRSVYYEPFELFGEEWVWSAGANAGAIFGWAGDDVRLTDRFFKGGNSFRGFETAGMGPRDLNTTDALGGNFYAIGTVELTVPNYLPEQYGIKTSLFADVGTLGVLDDRYKLTSTGTVNTNIADELSLRASAGVSIHWKSPMGPIRFDISKVLSKEDYDKTESFRFSTSTQF